MLDVVFVDVDGTLVGTADVVSPAVWSAAERARAAGIRLVLCSGRPAFGKARAYAERLQPAGWHVFQNGASVVHVGTGESRSLGLPSGATERLMSRADETGRILELYTDGDYAVERDTDRARRHADLLGVPFTPRPFASLRGGLVRAQWLIARGEMDAVAAEPHPGLYYAPSVSPVMPDSAFVNITAEGVDKGLAVRTVMEAYGVSAERAMMVGDGANDVSALHAVGHAVAMGNAEPEALAASTRTVAHVDDDGLVEALTLAMEL